MKVLVMYHGSAPSTTTSPPKYLLYPRSLSDLAVLNQISRDRIKRVYHERGIAAPFDKHDKHSLSVFVSFEQNMLNPTDS